MSELKAMKAVYCYLFPEVKPLLKEVEERFPDFAYHNTVQASVVTSVMSKAFDPPFKFPANPDGTISLDEMHVPAIERIKERYRPHVKGLDGYIAYPTPGSSEGIFKVMNEFRKRGVREIAVLPGEYEGYAAYAAELGLKVKESSLDAKEPMHWFISNPSARDGNIVPNEEITALLDRGHKVALDLAYVGATRPYEFDASHPNIEAVFISMSKPYGMFRFRSGFTFTREPVNALYGSKWFKDPVRVLQALKVVEDIGPCTLHPKYSTIQKRIIEKINEEHRISLEQSDVFLLANTRDLRVEQQLSQYRRGDAYRLCLTPYFEEEERRR